MSKTTKLKIDDLDKRLVAALQADGRRSNVDLATDLGVSEKTVRNRINRLVDGQLIRISATWTIEDTATQAIFLIHANPGRRFALGERLRTFPEVTEVLLTNGAAELLVFAAFDDADEALRFLVTRIETSPDVRDSAACSIISRVGADDRPMSNAQVPVVHKNELARAVLHTPTRKDIQGLLQWLSDTMLRCFAADHAACIIYDLDHDPLSADRRKIAACATSRLSAGYIEAINTSLKQAKSTGVVQHAFNTGQHVFIDNAPTSKLMAGAEDVMRAEGITSMVTFPMLFGSLPFGVCNLYYDSTITIDERFVAAAQNFVDQCSIVVARTEPALATNLARLFEAESSAPPNP